mgnify:CR=1 FL=1
MCWEVRITVNLQQDIPENRAAVTVPHPTDFEIIGKFPKFEFCKNGCACDLMKDCRGKIIGLVPTVEYFLEQPKIKSVEVLWFWLSEEPNDPPTEKVEFEEFSCRAESGKLKQDTIFKVLKNGQHTRV